METNLNALADLIFDGNLTVGWWTKDEAYALEHESAGPNYSKPSATLIASKLALVHSEVSEALEGMRKGLMDDHLPHRTMFEVELADAIIRILDLAGACNLDIDGAVNAKLAYNKTRADHKLANRQTSGGKTI